MTKTIKWMLGALAILLIIFCIYNVIRYYHQHPPGRPKGTGAKIQSVLANSRAQADGIYQQTIPHSYKTVCDDQAIKSSFSDIKKATKGINKCFSDDDSFVVASIVYTDENTTGLRYACADSSGKFTSINDQQYTAITNADTLCP